MNPRYLSKPLLAQYVAAPVVSWHMWLLRSSKPGQGMTWKSEDLQTPMPQRFRTCGFVSPLKCKQRIFTGSAVALVRGHYWGFAISPECFPFPVRSPSRPRLIGSCLIPSKKKPLLRAPGPVVRIHASMAPVLVNSKGLEVPQIQMAFA